MYQKVTPSQLHLVEAMEVQLESQREFGETTEERKKL
jgi:hypothetical protein